MTITGSFDSSDTSTTLFMCDLYYVVGSLAILAAMLNIAVFGISRETLKRRVLHAGYDLGEIFNGISYLMTAYGRQSSVFAGTFTTPISVKDCFFTKNWVIPLIVGTEFPAMIVIVLAVERIVAVKKIVWYNKFFTTISKCCTLASIVVIQLISIGVGAYSAWTSEEEFGTRHCSITGSTGAGYSSTHFSFVVLAYCISFMSLFVLYIADRTTSKMLKMDSKNRHQTLSLLWVSGLSIILVSMPSVIMLGTRWSIFIANDVVVGITYSGTGIMSIANTVLNITLQPSYRSRFLQLIGIKRRRNSAAVTNIKTCQRTKTTTGRVSHGTIGHCYSLFDERSDTRMY